MTVQEIQEIGFEKAVFGGYDMQSVDTFLERVAEEFAAMQKENASLKAKMKVLVDKVEEYRGVEDGIRRTLMSAQSIAQETVDKAKAEAAQLIAAAKTETETKVESTRDEIEFEEKKLETAKKHTAEFIARVALVYQAQSKALEDLAKSEKLTTERPAAPQQPTQPLPTQQPAPAAQKPADDEDNKVDAAEETAEAAENAVQADEPLEDATRKFDFGELKFGAEYDPTDEK